MDLEELGNRIRLARERLGLSQEAFANLVDKTQNAVSEYENGKRKISITELPRFAEVLQVPLLFFFGHDLNRDDLDYALLDIFHQLPNDVKPEAIDVMQRLLAITELASKSI